MESLKTLEDNIYTMEGSWLVTFIYNNSYSTKTPLEDWLSSHDESALFSILAKRYPHMSLSYASGVIENVTNYFVAVVTGQQMEVQK